MATTSVPNPMLMSIATPSRDSMTFTSTKGLLNGPGQNNCFLNSAVQVLWHLDIFRRSFRDLSGHACMAESCIFCALKELFSQLQFSNETALPPDALRRALAESFFDQQRFQLGFMDDAAECFENMLLRIHMHIAHGEAEDMCNARHCIPHQKFAMTLVEQSVCGSCGATSEPLSYTQMVHYVSTSTLVYQVRNNANQNVQDNFGQLLRKAGNMGDVRVCPSACGAVIQIGRTLMNRPEIVSIGLVWNSERPTLEHIMEVFSTIGTSLRLSDVFNTVVDSRWVETNVHSLVGVVTYYGKHYSTFFFHTKLRVWIYFDDATVREIGPRWEQVVEKCRKGRYQPLLLLYALPDGTPVNTENAPKHITAFVDKNAKKPLMRRSITPSPEKPTVNNTTTRRAITPNPDGTLNQKPPLPRPYNEYQNLAVIQNNIYGTQNRDVVDGEMMPRPKPQVHRTLSNSSSSGVEISDHIDVIRRRDSGNSTSSSSAIDYNYNRITGSPTRVKSDSSSGSSAVYDAGYDSYSLSSNDSSTMTTLQHLMKTGHLAKIPEDYNNSPAQPSQNCDELCDEADEFLVKSRQLEDEHDLVLALALCNAAATKARAAMNAPYNNPQTLTLARMKHNTCIMRARSLHRRMTQNQTQGKDQPPEIRHTREGSSGSGRHSRQNSRDKGQHSRQNSRELLVQPQEKPSNKNIEIYATLPKKKDGFKNKVAIDFGEDEDYIEYEKPARESRSIFSRSKNKEANKMREKRSRSEDRNKMTRDFSIAPESISGKDTLKREKSKEDKDDKKEKDGKAKKQHKIRRKLLMGGLIKRKNRSMPDLTDSNVENERPIDKLNTTVDDSKVGIKPTESNMCGYLSEGHLEFSGNNTANPNLERSKLMRKSFHGSAGKILTAAKVPPPPPLRTTSQLSTSKPAECEQNHERPMYPLPTESINFHQYHPNVEPLPPQYNQSPVSLPYMHYYDYKPPNNNLNMVVTKADVHQEFNTYNNNSDQGVDEVDCLPSHSSIQNFELPPYPSPMGSVIHSRQASEDFPPPPPPLNLSALDEHLREFSQLPPCSSNSLLAQLQDKRQEILSQEPRPEPIRSSADTWLKELQAKQAALRMKKNQQLDESNQNQRIHESEDERKASSVKDLATKFENIQIQSPPPTLEERKETIAPEQIAEEIREVEMLNAAVQKSMNKNNEEYARKNRLGKKKSVSFCDQVILVATADEQEDDSYIPNPILERVLRSAINKPEIAAIRQEIMSLREAENARVNNEVVPEPPINHIPQQIPMPVQPKEELYVQQPMYVRRNSVDNLLSRPNPNPMDYNCQPQQFNGNTPYRQSPYQAIPQNSPVYIQAHNAQYKVQTPHYPQDYNHQYNQYSTSPRNAYNQQLRQSPNCYNGQPNYQHSPSPSPSNLSSNYVYQQQARNSPSNNYHQYPQQYPAYQRVPQPHIEPYQKFDNDPYYNNARHQNGGDPNLYYHHHNEFQQYNMVPNQQYNQQRVPPPHLDQNDVAKYPVYQHALAPKQLLKKSVSFEPGTKGGTESPIPKAVVTPIVVNNANNSVPTGKTKCNLCRKKSVASVNLYCTDCEFYMSRFNMKS